MELCQERGDEEWEYLIKSTYKRQKITSCPRKYMACCFWINEKTGDYVVAWSHRQNYLFTYKKGDDYWCSLEDINCSHMAFKEDKLYVYTFYSYIKILDFSGYFPNEIIKGNLYRNHPFHYAFQPDEYVWKIRVAITNSGEVLIVVSMMKELENKRFFYIFKMNLESGNWERVDSLGGEMLIFGHGVTIKGVNGWGIKSDSICFGNDDLGPSSYLFEQNRNSNCGVFDLGTSIITSLDDSFSKSFWFVPGYA